ncbi:MAG: hypothetical protein KDH20_06545 [Rhodocyclaceae bacterium]|nr:hypothetical protein [Rhodocyclaceae bacterium]
MSMRRAAIATALLLIGTAGLSACSSRAWYDGLQASEARRQAHYAGEPARTAPRVDFATYSAERDRVNSGGAP